MHLLTCTRAFALLLAVLLVGVSVEAQHAPAPATRPATAPATRPARLPAMDDEVADRLGPRFTSRSAGISFRPPAFGKPDRRLTGSADRIVRFGEAEGGSVLVVSRKFFPQKTVLIGDDAPALRRPGEARAAVGVLDELARQLRANDVNTQVLRKELVHIGPYDVGLLATRFIRPGSRDAFFRQHAMVRAHEQLYYVFDLTTPSGWSASDKPDAVDPQEKLAVRVFEAMLDSVQLIDTTPVEQDVAERRIRSRSLMITLGQRLQDSVAARTIDVPQDPQPQAATYLRILKGGKDVGYKYMAEFLGARRGEGGVYVSFFEFEQGDKGMKYETAGEMFSTLRPLDKNVREEWVTIRKEIAEGGKARAFSEYGSSKKRTAVVRDDQDGAQRIAADGERAARMGEFYTLTVRQISHAGARPLTWDLSPFYLPQTMSHILPRLLPLNEPRTYAFAAWMPSAPAVVSRFLDVEPERNVRFNGQTIRAVRIKDRLGYEGDPTYHYFQEGQYLGSWTESADVTVLVSDAASLKRLWPTGRLGRPENLLDEPEPAPERAARE
jgi:hypothetical protein